ncbi:DNA methyltransferase [Paraglaciecola arctica]|uniref:DNA methyltransferase n=1 Tax=Paraglaciecola arctica TaxID=1128911 RepID=UPI001C07325D|nr:DNA methyltransferase [Paraglaciecola arctica]MBU3004276.1 hypothetical protein [Paraglaciecola arctica]
MSESYKKLIKTLQSMFEMDKADLDFGIYRIMNQKRDEINRFLENDLLPQVKNAFSNVGNDSKADLQRQLTAEIEQARKYGAPDPENSPAVLEIKKKLENTVDGTALENEVFSRLQTFFSRYYDKGDFISQRRYKADTYAIPYQGEEVKLYWANHDQYYIKSSEHLKDYAFIAKDPNNQEIPFRIHLIEADTEKDNVKAKSGEERRFVIDSDNPLSIKDGELLINFQFIPAGKKKQDKLNDEAVKTIFAVNDSQFSEWLTLLETPAPTEKNKNRTLLEKHLNDYTARNTFDYFIHKDLGGFLNRELDFFIKNEVIHLDDLDDTAFELTQLHLNKAKIIKSIALKMIQMLSQIEDFQKKLWLKKKFITESNYLVSINLVPDALLSDIISSESQISEWKKLGLIVSDDITLELLSSKQNLIVDTAFFSIEFKHKLLSSFDDFDDVCDGVLIKSENFQALNFIENKFKDKIKSIYIDPPYNTSLSEIIYKNSYKHSSWLSLISDRLKVAKKLASKSSNICMTIDDYELPFLTSIGHNIFGEENHHSTAVIRSKPQGRPSSSGFSVNHEYAIFYGLGDSSTVGRLPRVGSKANRYPEKDAKGIFAWSNFRKSGGDSYRSDRPKSYYPVYLDGKNLRIPQMEWDEAERNWIILEKPLPAEEVFYPIDELGKERVWTISRDRAIEESDDLEVRITDKDTQIQRKYRPNQSGSLPGTWWDDAKYSASESGTKVLQNYLGSTDSFSYPKSIHATSDCLRVLDLKKEDICLDFFAGSGTTGQAVMELNRLDDGHRKFILVEMGEHFDSALKARLIKAAYSTSWKNGQCLDAGESALPKFLINYITLESYEDSLQNLRSKNNETELQLIHENDNLKEDYYLNYWLDLDYRQSDSLLNINSFEQPFGFKMLISAGSVGASQQTEVDLISTFNYLLGLHLKSFDDFNDVITITGLNPKNELTLIVWRNQTKISNDKITSFLEKQGINPKDTEFEHIYINGDHTLDDPHSKVKLIEAEFKRLMFDVQDV